ncbi:unnamed protein product [Coregonus sp. 'balchen']|nr:unnamed protein product [Coregonus sp. 'balchen']
MSGQSITDRIAAAQHSMTGSAISKAVCKATTHEVSGPKKKHLDYLIHCTNELNVSVPHLADTLFERTANNSWVVWSCVSLVDRVDGVMRTMTVEKLIKTLPIIQNQLDALLDFQANSNELTNGVINGAFMLLFKDSIRLFAAYNEGVINMLEKYFDMKKNQCKDALEIYKTFLNRMTKLSEFLKVAESHEYYSPMYPAHLANTLSSAVSSLSSTGISLSRMDEKEDENRLKDEGAKVIDMQTPTVSPSAQSVGSANSSSGATDVFSNSSVGSVTNNVPNLTSLGLPGDLLKPAQPTHIHSPGIPLQSGGKMMPTDLDSSLANLVGNLQFGGTSAKKPELQWTQLVEKKPTGGTHWQSKTMCTTPNWNHHAPMAPQPMPIPQMMPPHQMGQMGGVPMMAPQHMMYNQPVLRHTNPFAPMPGAQYPVFFH